ncbi:baculoviral IAP repeat-containing protein 6 [Cylas formicarius]|uniref:baculoviral IAP repeat-containing protein 6 n=1 Tax=Cylas formicarius TaxID=197179 RepID=UPI002958CE64|nr:baculoviral IAP repeat-containing protein 6 [Cylas formicarius]
MAQDVFSKMAEDSWLLNEDGYLKVDTDVKEIIYHPSLNVILICTSSGIVRVLDVNSGVLLQSSNLSAINQNEVKCQYIPGEDRVLFCDGQAIGVRSHYNGVLLLDSILQKTLSDGKEIVKLELPLSEAIILKQSLSTAVTIVNHLGTEHIVTELNNAILNAQKFCKKGIKAQKWNTVCLSIPIGDLRTIISSVVSEFVAKKIQTPDLQVVSAVQERLSELLDELTVTLDKNCMASEARRRETFSQWPHMDYKWALPEQMAQAGFYHQPNASGDDRVMCFTCTVCLVSWERTDEPWSEHERHSPTCPFVVGEYTQNVPISVTNATGPAIDCTFVGSNINILGTSSVPKLFPTCTSGGLIAVFDISGKIKRTHAFVVTHFDSHILERFTQDFGVPGIWNEEAKSSIEKNVTALSIVGDKGGDGKDSTRSPVRSTIICGLSITSHLNNRNEDFASTVTKTWVDPSEDRRTCLYLVVYDFLYKKEEEESVAVNSAKDNKENDLLDFDHKMQFSWVSDPPVMDGLNSTELHTNDGYSLIKELTSFYKTLIPGESDEVFLPPSESISVKKNHTGPRVLSVVDVENTEADSSTSDVLNGLTNGPLTPPENLEPSISDHIVDLKNNQSAILKLNYVRAVQCILLPERCRNRKNLEISNIFRTQDGGHLFVTVSSKNSECSFLLVYELDFTGKMVKVKEEAVTVRELSGGEQPIEVDLLPVADKLGSSVTAKPGVGIRGHAVSVCADGAVRIVDLATLQTACVAKIDAKKFVSATYCNSLDRLCASTKEGSLHFFALNDTDNESVDEHEEDELFGLNIDSSLRELSSLDKNEVVRCFKEPPNVISVEELRSFQGLCQFTPIRGPYNVTVPLCWSEFQQAMRQRKSPSALNSEAWTKTWRLQTDTTTWEEHVFEITLPSYMVLGHVDVHFTLQNSTSLPHVEVTLLRQTKSGIGHNRDVRFAVDDTVTIDMLQWVDNPVVSEEYLRAQNADILAGPVNLSSHLDLTDQSGIVTLTSPRMFKLKVRNLLLHIRAVYAKDENKLGKLKKQEGKVTISVDKLGMASQKSDFYMGCDCIHELSLAVYNPMSFVTTPHEKTLRNLMLESNIFVQSLIMTAVNTNNRETLGLVLDILNWLAAIRLTRNRANSGEAPNHQLEFMFINGIEDNMTGLLKRCLLLSGRSIAHKCMNYIITCCRGAKNISKSIGEHFSATVLNSLLIILDSLNEAVSPAGLHWIFSLLLKVSTKENEHLVSNKCLELLKRVSDNLTDRFNPYHLLLRSRYGLYGLPMEPELFDVDPPSYAKGSSNLPYFFSSTTAAATTNESTVVTESPAPNAVAKDGINPRDVLSNTDSRLKYKNLAFPKLVKGLIETEPLHFTCVNTSEGTRLEVADAGNNVQTTINNILPIVMSAAQPGQKKKEDWASDFQHFIQKYVEKNQNLSVPLHNIIDQDQFLSTAPTPGAGPSKWIMFEMTDEELEQKLENVYKGLVETYGSSVAPKSAPQQVSVPTVQHLPPSEAIDNLPWQQLLVPPPKQIIVVERMHSGARRHVTLDFGESVVLTDILIPSCSDLVTLSIDVWLFGEEIDAVRLVTASDIGTKNLLLSDLQPPPLFKFMKITLVGRYGMSTTRCRIPLGYFYGHVVVLPEEVPHDVFVELADVEKQVAILSKLLEDISCRYSLACSKLKNLLQPFLVADIKNAMHLSAYMNILKDKSLNVTNAEHSQIFSVYQETLTYQHQLNTIRHVMTRLEGSVLPSGNAVSNYVASDKLVTVAEGLLEVLLSVDTLPVVDSALCQQLFEGLCVSQSPRLQVLSALFLEKSCGSSVFWGNFLSDTLVRMFSTSYTSVFPQDRLFILLAYLSRKSNERSAIIDSAMRVVYDTLKPLESRKSLLLAVSIDLPLLSWLLMYLSLQLSVKNASGKPDRWDWVMIEMVGKGNADSNKNNSKKKNCKRMASTFGGSFGLSSPAIPVCYDVYGEPPKLFAPGNKHYWKTEKFNKFKFSKKAPDSPKPEENKEIVNKDVIVPQKMPQYIDSTHCLALSKLLLKFIINMDHSGSADMMLLSFKIVSRLVTMARLQLCQLLKETELLELMKFSLSCKVAWAPFALICFLQDVLELAGTSQTDVTKMDTDASTSASWVPSDASGTNETDITDNFCAISTPKPKIITNPNTFPPLPSVFESDDSDFEELLEDFEKVRCTVSKANKATVVTTSNVSTTIDARLETGVYASSETYLCKLVARNTQKLLHNISNEAKTTDQENELVPWPNAVGPFQPESTFNNHKMLAFCFDDLFKNLQNEDPLKIENILHLWLTLNCVRKDEKFDSSSMPQMPLQPGSVKCLISALARTPGLSLTTWCLGLQTLTLVCNTNNNGKCFDLSGMANTIVSHPDFVQMFLSLLSGTGLTFTEKAVAGPTLCRALHDFLVRLQVRCDMLAIVSPSNKLGNLLKSLLLNVVYEMTRPGGPVSAKMGPLDAQCKLLQLIYRISNIDVSIGMSTLENTASLLKNYFISIDNVKCVTVGEKSNTVSNTFGDIFASVLGTDSNKQDRPVSYEDLLISLLKLLGKLVQTPITVDNPDAMDTDASVTSQTDESKAEQIQQDSVSAQATPCFADTVLQHHPTVICLCRCLALCKSSSLCMLATVSQKASLANLSEPNTVGDAVFHILTLLAKRASRKMLLMPPLLQFLSQSPQLSEPLIWFILQVLDSDDAIRCFSDSGGISVLASSIIRSSNAPSTLSRNGTISTVMQHFNGFNSQSDNATPIGPASANKLYQASMENSSLINFAPYCTITCQSVTSQPADVLIQGLSGVTHRRARTPLWSYNYYQEETHTELLLQLPSAVLLKEVHLQPHAGGLATCPSYVAIETSANGPSRLVPAGHPLPTSGLTYIRLHLPQPKVVNCILIRLYKPRVGNSIGLLQIRLLGTYAFGRNVNHSVDLDDESHCSHSLGWLRLLHHCFTLDTDEELRRQVIECSSNTPGLLSTCCGLLLVPSHILPVYLPCLEKVLRELALFSPENGIETIKILLDNRLSMVEPMMSLNSVWQDKLMINVSGYQSACDLLYQICEYQDANTRSRVQMILDWLRATVNECLTSGNTGKCNAAYLSCIASILWSSHQSRVPYDLRSLITTDFFDAIYNLKMRASNNSLKYALDSLLCSFCYIQSEFFPLLLQKIGVLVPNLSTDPGASISDDRKDVNGMTDDHKQCHVNSEWYGHLVIGELSELTLTKDELETVALASRSPNAIQQLLDSGLPKLLNSAILEFCHPNDLNNVVPMAKLENVTAILQFFTDVCDEKVLRDWLGSPDGSSFWPHLLHWLCQKPFNSANIHSEAHVNLEEICVKFLAKCCLCHTTNQARLAKVLCEVISLQPHGITGFLRRLVLQLLLENEKVPVSVEADETLYKNFKMSATMFTPSHPAFKQAYNRTMLYLSTNTTLADILEQHLFFNSAYKSEAEPYKKVSTAVKKYLNNSFVSDFSDLSVAAGVTAKDKRAKDMKNQATATPQTKKKRYAADLNDASEALEGRLVKALAFSEQPLPLTLNLGQLLRMIETKGAANDWPYIHLTICQSKGNDDKNYNQEALEMTNEQLPVCSALQVFSSMGGLALLAEHLPSLYPEAIRMPTVEKNNSEQSDSDWIKVEECDDIYEDIEETIGGASSPSKSSGGISHIPPHSLTAFSLFLRLPGYAEVLLKDSKKALCLLRLMLGVTDDGEGGDIFQSAVATSLPTLPFEILQKLYDSTPLCSDDGRLLRGISVTTGVVQLLLACLGILTHHSNGGSDKDASKSSKNKEDRQLYWAKGTGFGTGSTQQSWNVEQALLKQRNEEEHVTVLLQVLASFINPNDEASEELNGNVLPSQFSEFLSNSSLLPAVSSYLRNDSVLDMARHIPLYKAVLKILRALAVSSQLVNLLLPQKNRSGEPSVSSLLKNMKTCVDTYASKLKVQNPKTQGAKSPKSKLVDLMDELEQGEGLATLMPDIQSTANLVAKVTNNIVDDKEGEKDGSLERMLVSPEEQYLRVMRNLQFASFEMIEELPDGGLKFAVSHHFESNAKATTEQSHPARVKRIAQEAVTLSTSLPLSYSSSVFVRYDTSRLDVMKVLITGPADTPYANGCFELDVFFPPDYPMSPMLINLETTGHRTVRFNPNLYNDGKVCLSVLNTWHGRPEEKWNAQTSSFLQVLVSIQSLILVPEPYFNEPGYERTRGTPAGTANSKDYNLNICQATVRWAMLDQILNPCPCFKDVIHAHFYMKRDEIIAQTDKWIQDLESETKKEKKNTRGAKKNRTTNLESFKKVFKQLQEQLAKLKPPGLDIRDDDEEEDEESPTTPTNSMDVAADQDHNKDIETDKDMVMKMVNDMFK